MPKQNAEAKLECNCDSLITNLGVFLSFLLIYGKYFPVKQRRSKAVENGWSLFQREKGKVCVQVDGQSCSLEVTGQEDGHGS